MRFRKLRIAFSALCAIACVLLIVLWVRSYVVEDRLFAPLILSQNTDLQLRWGHISVTVFEFAGDLPVEYKTWRYPKDALFKKGVSPFSEMRVNRAGFGVVWFPKSKRVVFPYWLPVGIFLLFTSLAAAPWLPHRFTLRTLLVATTLVAAVLGLVAYALRK